MWDFSRRGRRRRPRPAPLGSSFVFLDRADAARRRDRLEELSSGLRRVRRDIEVNRRQEFLPGKSTRVRAGRLAYVDLLLEACLLLGVEHELDRLAGIDQQLEVLRVEGALGVAGLPMQAAG